MQVGTNIIIEMSKKYSDLQTFREKSISTCKVMAIYSDIAVDANGALSIAAVRVGCVSVPLYLLQQVRIFLETRERQ